MKTSHVVSAVVLASSLLGCGVSRDELLAAQNDAQKEHQKNVALEAKVGNLQTALAQTNGKEPPKAGDDEALKAQIAELQKEKAAAEARSKTLDDFLKRFQKLIDAGKLDITVRHGQIVLALANDVLFDAGKTEIKPEGKASLEEIADVIKGVPGRRFQVAGHTDPTPIKTREFPSNWELSTARAVVVVKLLGQKGVRAAALSAAGFAESDPVGNNATNVGRAKNRRIEIVMLPSIEEIVGSQALAKLEDEAQKREEAREKNEPESAAPTKPAKGGATPKAPPAKVQPSPKKPPTLSPAPHGRH